MWWSVVVFALPNAVHSTLAACILNPSRFGDVLADALVLALVLWPESLQSVQAMLRRWVETRGATRAAAAIACLISQTDPRDALEQARRSFRSIDVSQLTFGDLRDNKSDPRLNSLAEPTKLGHCDAFVSHSWHDDATAKWEALQRWRSNFRARHGRDPRVWFDKFCINQSNIEADLRCLPICLGGCQSLLILCGPTYLSRLWCIIEVFTFIMMGGSIEDIEVELVQREESTEEDTNSVISSFEDFDAANCSCFHAADKARILFIVETAFGSLRAFNNEVVKMLDSFQTDHPVVAPLSRATRRLNVLKTLLPSPDAVSVEEHDCDSLGHDGP